MNVRLDEARQHVAAARVDHAVVALGDVRSDGGDAAVLDRDVAVDDVVAVVERHDLTAADQERHEGKKKKESLK